MRFECNRPTRRSQQYLIGYRPHGRWRPSLGSVSENFRLLIEIESNSQRPSMARDNGTSNNGAEEIPDNGNRQDS